MPGWRKPLRAVTEVDPSANRVAVGELGQVLVDGADGGRPLADRRRDALHRPDPDIAGREYPVHRGLVGQPRPNRDPALRDGPVGQHEPVVVPGHLRWQPAARWLRADEAE